MGLVGAIGRVVGLGEVGRRVRGGGVGCFGWGQEAKFELRGWGWSSGGASSDVLLRGIQMGVW